MASHPLLQTSTGHLGGVFVQGSQEGVAVSDLAFAMLILTFLGEILEAGDTVTKPRDRCQL